MSISSQDLEWLLQQPSDLLTRYASTLSGDAGTKFLERITGWRIGKKLEFSDYAALKMYRSGIERLTPKNPPAPQQSYEEKKLSLQEAEELLIEKARNDVAFYIEYVTDKKPAKHHLKWLANIFSPDHRFVNLVAPPGSGKTHVLVAVLSFIIGKYPLWTNAVISVSDAQAQVRLSDVKKMVEHNERYHNVFPHIKIDSNRTNNMSSFSVWDERMSYPAWWTLVQTQGHSRDPSLFAAGSGNTGIIGRRWSGLCAIDDMVDQTMLTSQLMKEAFQFVAVTLLSRLTKTGRAVNIGTRWMADDLIQRLKDNTQWHTIEIAAIYYDENANPHSYWPEWWSLKDLEDKRLSMQEEGEDDMMFQLMYLGNTEASAAGLFTRDVLAVDLPSGFRDLLLFIYITTDWALKTKERNDFSVFQAVGIDKNKNLYLLDQKRIKQGPESSPTVLGEFADAIAAEYGFLTDILVESVAFQDVMGVLLQEKRPDLPYIAVAPKGDKGFRAKLVSNAAHAGKLYINQRMEDLEVLKREWVNFGTAQHDDTLDPIGLLIQYMGIHQVTAKVHMFKSPYLL